MEGVGVGVISGTLLGPVYHMYIPIFNFYILFSSRVVDCKKITHKQDLSVTCSYLELMKHVGYSPEQVVLHCWYTESGLKVKLAKMQLRLDFQTKYFRYRLYTTNIFIQDNFRKFAPI